MSGTLVHTATYARGEAHEACTRDNYTAIYAATGVPSHIQSNDTQTSTAGTFVPAATDPHAYHSAYKAHASVNDTFNPAATYTYVYRPASNTGAVVNGTLVPAATGTYACKSDHNICMTATGTPKHPRASTAAFNSVYVPATGAACKFAVHSFLVVAATLFTFA